MLSSALTVLCMLSHPSSLLYWPSLACCGLQRFLFHRLQTGAVVLLFLSTYTNPLNPSTCPCFLTTAPALILIRFPYNRCRSITLSLKLCVSSSSQLKERRDWHYCFALGWPWPALVFSLTIAFVKYSTCWYCPHSVWIYAYRKALCSWSSCFARWSLHDFELFASPWLSFANSDRSGNFICSDISQIHLDSSSISWLTVMTSNFSFLLHPHCYRNITYLRIIEFPCIPRIGIGDN